MTTFSPIKKGMSVTLSQNNTIASTSANGLALCTKPAESWAFRVISDHYGYSTLGVGCSGIDLNGYVGGDENGMGVIPSGAVVYGGNTIANMPAYTVGDVVGFSLNGNKLKVYLNGTRMLTLEVHSKPWVPAAGASSGGGTTHRIEKLKKTWLQSFIDMVG